MSDKSGYVTLEQVEELLEQQRAELTAEFEARLEAKDDQIVHLEERVDELESSHDVTQSTLWDLEDIVTGDYDFSHPHLQGESVIDHVDDLENRLEASNSKGSGGETTLQDDWTPIECLSILGEDTLDDHVSASDRRAVAVFNYWEEWSTATPSGQLLKTSDSLRSLLSTATDERLAWKQVYRACHRVEQLSKGAITFFQHDKHGWMLKQHSAFASNQATNTGLTSSSVA